eukprot:COSAG01_NODE_3708_length_5771_cov_15.214210_3_plen_209_part_00
MSQGWLAMICHNSSNKHDDLSKSAGGRGGTAGSTGGVSPSSASSRRRQQQQQTGAAAGLQLGADDSSAPLDNDGLDRRVSWSSQASPSTTMMMSAAATPRTLGRTRSEAERLGFGDSQVGRDIYDIMRRAQPRPPREGGSRRAAGAPPQRQSSHVATISSASASADSAPRRFRCGSLLPAADSAHKWTFVHFLRQGCRGALVRWGGWR